MAIDTAAKRASAMGVAMPWMPLVYPDATLSEEWRATAAFVYGGNALTAYDQLCIKEHEIYCPGSRADQIYSPGAAAEETYTPDFAAHQIGC